MFRGVCSLQSVKYFWQSSAVYLAQMVFFSDLPRPSLSNVFNSMETTPVLQTSNSILTGFAAKKDSVVKTCLSIAFFRWWLSWSLVAFKSFQIVWEDYSVGPSNIYILQERDTQEGRCLGFNWTTLTGAKVPSPSYIQMMWWDDVSNWLRWQALSNPPVASVDIAS